MWGGKGIRKGGSACKKNGAVEGGRERLFRAENHPPKEMKRGPKAGNKSGVGKKNPTPV